MALQVVRKKTGETLICAGGQWDSLEQRYTGRDPDSARVVRVVESQVPLIRWYAEQLDAMAAGHPRDTSLGLAVGDRRAGKTVASLGCAVATNVEVPRIGWHGLITWVVGVTRPEMQELDRYLQWMLPAAWYDYAIQEHVYRLVSGSEIFTITADNPKTLKRGEANLIVLNEGQKMPVAVLSNAIMGAVDHDGMCLIAANQPEDRRGEWIAKLQKGVRNGSIGGTAVFPMNSRDNDEIDQTARSRAAAILKQLDPDAYRRDVLDENILQEGKALPQWDAQVHVRPRPEVGLVDITPQLAYSRVGRPYTHIIGADFQGYPYMPAPVFKAFGTARLRDYLEGRLDRELLDPDVDLPRYWIVDDVIVRNCTEHELCDALWVAGYRPDAGPRSAYIVGDASGSWQNAQHKQGDDSFAILQSRRWRVVPPFEARLEAGVKPLNPRIRYRVNLCRDLLGWSPDEIERRRQQGQADRVVSEPRLFIEPGERTEFGRAALEQAELKVSTKTNGLVPFGFHAHYFDAAGYVLCHLEPQPEDRRRDGGDLPDLLVELMQNRRQARG